MVADHRGSLTVQINAAVSGLGTKQTAVAYYRGSVPEHMLCELPGMIFAPTYILHKDKT